MQRVRNQWPLLRVLRYLRYIVMKLVYVLQIWGEALRFRKVRSQFFTQNACRFSLLLRLFHERIPSTPQKKAKWSRMSGPMIIAKILARAQSSCDGTVVRKRKTLTRNISVIDAHDSFTVIHNTYGVIIAYAPYNNDTFPWRANYWINVIRMWRNAIM